MNRSLRWLVVSLIGLWIAATSIARADAAVGGQAGAAEYVRFAATHHGDAGRGRMLFADSQRLAWRVATALVARGVKSGLTSPTLAGSSIAPCSLNPYLNPLGRSLRVTVRR